MAKINYSVTRFGKKVPKSEYTIDVENKTFSANDTFMVVDLGDENNWEISVGYNCVVVCGSYCSVTTKDMSMVYCGGKCRIVTSHNCSVHAGDTCTFDVGEGCSILALYGFESLKTRGNTSLILPIVEAHHTANIQDNTYLKDSITIFFSNKKGILYTEDKLDRETYLVRRELIG